MSKLTGPEPAQQCPSPVNPEAPREWSTRIFLGFLAVITCLYGVILVYHTSRPTETVTEDAGILEQCRQLCLKYGLVSTGHVRNDAQAYLEVAQTTRLTEALAEILADATFQPVKTEPVSLLNQPAPDFDLPDHTSAVRRLSDLSHNRPVVVVFYLGYGCSHCVAQLLALDKDLHYFRELDADIVAISSDSAEHTSERYKEYGEFHFPVLADADNSVARQWGVYEPENGDRPEVLNHGTFIVDRNGRVIWGETGKEPFLDNKTLLHLIARSQGLLPSTPVAKRQ